MEYIFENPEKVKAFGEPAEKRIKAEYTWDKITRAYEELIIELSNK
jgi:glycosyltransferase involved in cell wall biosynthesis